MANISYRAPRAFLYIRVSSEKQAADEKASIPTQLDDCRKLAEARGYTIVAEFIDAERYRSGGKLVEPSGTRADRPKLLEMIARARAGECDVIIAWREDRLYRSLRSASLIDDLIETTGIKIELVKENFDRSMLGFRAAIGRYEIQAIKDRTEMGRQDRYSEGLPISKIPLVYQREHDAATGEFVRYVFDERHRGFFDELARLYLAHEPYNRMAQILRVHPASGVRLHPSDVRRMTLDPFYRGRIGIGWRKNGYRKFDAIIDGSHAAVWDAVTCERIEQEIARRSRIGRAAPRGPLALFTGVLRCGMCGRSMGSFVVYKKGRPPARAYRCRQPDWIRYGYIGGEEPHKPNNIRETKIVRLFRGMLEQADIDGLLATLGESGDTGERGWVRDQLAKLEKEAGELEQDLEHIKSAASRGALSSELARLKEEIAILESQMVSEVRPEIDFAELRARMMELRNPEFWTHPPEVIRRALTDTFPAIYAEGGDIRIGEA